ncbi:uncharacterized protein LOC122790069 [Protopterus annectens]|uniref:uncharacterized protein LOC122790069 n=1 Tax=Protopterus annectens TaxID=7888 RepID=UPI001CFB4EA8|nr:uncharacterized protein LOC122790069 [Protopterus annectens]
MPGNGDSLHHSVGVLAISAGSLLLTVNSYSSNDATALLPPTSLGVLLLILAAILGYAGIRKSLGYDPVFVTLCLTISALWCGSGIIHILHGMKVLNEKDELRDALVPGLATFTLALFIIGAVGIFQKEVLLSMIAFSVSLSLAHEIVVFYESGIGRSAVACSYLIVSALGVYVTVGRGIYFLSKAKIIFPGTNLAKRKMGLQGQNKNDTIMIGLIMNMLSASVFGCKLLGVITSLFVGQVPWLWVAGLYQLGVCIMCYRSFDFLSATSFGFTSILKFAEGYALLLRIWEVGDLSFPVPFPVVFAILFFVLALFMTQKSLADGFYLLFFASYCITVAARPNGFFHGGFQGVNISIFAASAIMTALYLYGTRGGIRLLIGEGLIKSLLSRTSLFKLRAEKDVREPFLGYSRYADAEVLGHACSVLAAFAITMAVDPNDPLHSVVLPWVVVAGGLVQFVSGALAFARGKTLESTAFILYAIMWIVWGLTRYGGLYGNTRGFNLAVGIVCLMLFNGFVVVGTLFVSKTWFADSLTFMLILLSFLLDAINAMPAGYDIAVTIIFGLVSFYCFLSTLFNSSFESPQLPMGSPFIKLSGYGGGGSKCPHLPARKVTSVWQIAEILKNGGTCGVPSDTVYVLVAACNRPEAVAKAYKAKIQAQDRPISLWISSLKQLEPAKHLFSPLLWDFMEAAWPSSISLVIPRGHWLDCFGLKDSAKYIGTPQSIAVRIPDCSVTTFLIDLVGPIAVMSANPTGEADTTHHNQVYAKLGDVLDGVLCDGPSPENIASTVVDCTKIDSGNIGFFRVGLVPKSQVLQIFEDVQKKKVNGYINRGFISDVPQDNTAESDSPGVNFTEIPINGPKSDSDHEICAETNKHQNGFINHGFSDEDERL